MSESDSATMMHADFVTSAAFPEEDSEDESCSGFMTDQQAENKMMSMLEDGWGSTSSSVMDMDVEGNSSAIESQNATSTTSNNSDSDSSSVRDDSSDIFDSDDLDLVFLAAKRRLLRRVAVAFDAERMYHASVAKHSIAGKRSIWNDAKDIVKALSDGKSGHRQVRFAPNTKLWNAKIRPDKVPSQQSRKKTRIDVTTVTLIDSKEYVGHVPQRSPSDQEVQPYNDSAWMTQSLQQVSEMATVTNIVPPDIPTTSLHQLEATVDPLLVVAYHAAPVDVPHNGNSMEDALAISDSPKLIAQATPPFLVVYANKAFFILSKLTSAQVMYQPFQQVIAVDKSVGELLVLDNDNSTGSANGKLSIGNDSNDNNNNKNDNINPIQCQVHISPLANVTEIMSHVLVCVSHDAQHEKTDVVDGSLKFAVEAAAAAASTQDSILSVGTVG